MVRVQLKNTFKQHDLADDSEDNKHTYMYSAERRARAVMSSRKKKSLQQWLQPKEFSLPYRLVLCPGSQSQTQSF